MSTIRQQLRIRRQSPTTRRHDEMSYLLTHPEQLWEQLTEGQQQEVLRAVVLACSTLLAISSSERETMSHEQP